MRTTLIPDASPPSSQLAARAVHQRFAHRPSLFSVVFNTLRKQMLEHYPTLEMDLRWVKLASPQPAGHYTFQLLAHVALEQVLNPQRLDWRAKRELPFFLTEKIPRILKPSTLPLIDMQVIARIIATLPSTVPIYFQHAVADYWSEPDTRGTSRWQWLSEFLNGQMIAAAASRADLTQSQRDMLTRVATSPERLKRSPGTPPPTSVYFIETTLTRAGKEERLLSPDLLLVMGNQVLLYSVAGAIERFDSIDAFSTAWGNRMRALYTFDSLIWRRNEPDTNVFEQQAGLILNQQLADLASLTFQGHDERSMERRLDRLTDPALFFSRLAEAAPGRLEQVGNLLPQWIRQADAVDRFAYHRHLQDTAQVLQQNQQRSFNEGIENIQSFSRNALRKQMQADHADYDPDDVLLDFSVAAGYPGGAGIIGHVRMSLTDLALKNLAGKPKGTPKLSSKSAETLPSWLTNDYVLGSSGLIQRVDIGTIYPQQIQRLLLSDTADARRRETLFARELKVKLPTQALEYAIRKQYGVSATGYRYVKALLGDSVSDRTVDGEEIVLRPLALCRTIGATADTVNNFFIIEPRNPSVGPHLLYRPLYADGLYEYPTRQALLDAIAAPGELQDSVLTWLSDKARPVFANGGIKEPHIVHFTLGDEFGPYAKPAPATLAVDQGAEQWLKSQADGTLLNQLFSSTAQALVDLADRDSVSNGESRWAILMEGAWLLFNTLVLPLVQGPAMLAGWFLVLVSSLEGDLAGLDSKDPATKELALIDLLLNAAMVLLHGASSANRQPLPELAPRERDLHLTSWLRAAEPPALPSPLIRQGPVAPTGEPPANGRTVLDFRRSLASAKASKTLLEGLLSVHVPWPDPLPGAEVSGRLKGLYRIGNLWHASVAGLLFQVSVEPGFGDVYLIDPKRLKQPGYQLVSDGQGHWRLQRGARLEGGMPRERVERWSAAHQRYLNKLAAQVEVLRTQAGPLIKATREAREALEKSRAEFDKARKKLTVQWDLMIADARPIKKAEHLQENHKQRPIAAAAKATLRADLDKYLDAVAALDPVVNSVIAKRGEQMAADPSNANFVTLHDESALLQYNAWTIAFEYLVKARLDHLHLENGEHIDALSARVNEELRQGLTSAYEDYLNNQKALLASENQQIPVAEKVQTLLQQAEPALRERLLAVTRSDQYISPAPLEQSRLLTLRELVVDRTFHPDDEVQFPLAEQLLDSQLSQNIISHAEMRSTSGYSASDQITVLQDILEYYTRIENAFTSLSDLRSGYIRDEYRAPFLKQFSEARASLESQLSDLILVDEGFLPQSAREEPVQAKKPGKRVIKTNRGSLVGDLRSPATGAQGNLVDIIDANTGQTIATYQEQTAADIWQEVSAPQAATPAVEVAELPAGPAVRSVRKITSEADKILGERARIEGNIRFEQRQLKDPRRVEDLRPWEWDHMLNTPAAKLEALAIELQSAHAAEATAAQRATHYLAEAQAMKAQARTFCSEGYLMQRPRAAHIDYLLEHGFIEITLSANRIPLKAGDFLTEYAVHDKRRIKGGKPDNEHALWYAHFHYSSVDAPASPPDFAHLKTWSERKFTRKELFERYKKDPRAVLNLDKEKIPLALAEKLFLNAREEPAN